MREAHGAVSRPRQAEDPSSGEGRLTGCDLAKPAEIAAKPAEIQAQQGETRQIIRYPPVADDFEVFGGPDLSLFGQIGRGLTRSEDNVIAQKVSHQYCENGCRTSLLPK